LLSIIKNKNIAFETTEKFKHHLMACSGISIDDGKISLNEGNMAFDFKIREKNLEDSSKFYTITVASEDSSDEDVVESLAKLITKIKKFFTEYKNPGLEFYVIWNDMSTYYAQKAYPYINTVENTLRNLIFKFMLISVGSENIEKLIPKDMKSTINTRKNDNVFQHILWEMDFIDLIKFLFKSTRLSDDNKFDAFIKTKKEGDTISYSDLLPFISQSNWQRYFEDKIEIEPKNLEKKWEKLYNFRNKIAHNREFLKSDYENVEKLSEELKMKFEEAIKVIEQEEIQLTPEQKVEVKKSIDWSNTESTSLNEVLRKAIGQVGLGSSITDQFADISRITNPFQENFIGLSSEEIVDLTKPLSEQLGFIEDISKYTDVYKSISGSLNSMKIENPFESIKEPMSLMSGLTHKLPGNSIKAQKVNMDDDSE
jgi:hypothetical protein